MANLQAYMPVYDRKVIAVKDIGKTLKRLCFGTVRKTEIGIHVLFIKTSYVSYI